MELIPIAACREVGQKSLKLFKAVLLHKGLVGAPGCRRGNISTDAAARKRARRVLVFWVLSVCPVAVAAFELRGRVEFTGADLPGETAPLPVSVAAIPLQDQAVVQIPSTTHRVAVGPEGLEPLYLTIRAGDRVEFVNHTETYHRIYSQFGKAPFSMQLASAGDARERRTVRLDKPGIRHVFCMIHRRTYARIDVVDTPYIRMMSEPGVFQFTGLNPGLWRLRAATIGSPVQHTTARAFSAPPPVNIQFKARRRGPPGSGTAMYDPSQVKALFPQE